MANYNKQYKKAMLEKQHNDEIADLKKKSTEEKEVLIQIFLAAALLNDHDSFKVGPGRADKCLIDLLQRVSRISDDINSESKDDCQLVYTHSKLEESLSKIFGDKWNEYKRFFNLIIDS